MPNLTKTLMRDMRENEAIISSALERNGRLYYTIELLEEPGEICVTRLMEKEEVEETANEVVSKLFPGRKVSKVRIFDVYLGFEIN